MLVTSIVGLVLIGRLGLEEALRVHDEEKIKLTQRARDEGHYTTTNNKFIIELAKKAGVSSDDLSSADRLYSNSYLGARTCSTPDAVVRHLRGTSLG